MTQKILAIVILAIIVIGSGYLVFKQEVAKYPGGSGGVACTMEAMLCPDGSYVGRTGPNCEFAQCPGVNPTPTPNPTPSPQSEGTIQGRVTLSPTCPVERMPPDPNCAPRGYQTSISVMNGGRVVQTLQSDANGNFSATLPVGMYTLQAHNSNPYPRCDATSAVVLANQTSTADISCDTGIR